jgi:Uma2 family endonuclease
MASGISPVPPWRSPGRIIYPESDGQPMADNTLQWECIATLKNGFEELFKDRDDVFVAGDLLWYPVEGDPKTRVAPDTMIVFGRPKGHRGSYRQWEEDNIPPQVVFEVLSPGNTPEEMARKFKLYERLGVLEYYVYDPGEVEAEVRIAALEGWQRAEAGRPFEAITPMSGWRSQWLGVTFRFTPLDGMRIILPNGKPMPTYLELSKLLNESQFHAMQEQMQAHQERQRANRVSERIAQLEAQLRAAGIEPVGGGTAESAR